MPATGRKKTSKRGPRSILNKELADQICAEIRRIYVVKWAMRSFGKSERLFYKWLARGEDEIVRMERDGLQRAKKADAIYVYFVREFWKAQAGHVRGHSTNLQRGAFGQEKKIVINEKTGEPALDGQGNVIVIQPYIPPDPRLSKDYLARVDHENFGPKIRTEITTPDSGPTELRIHVVKKRKIKKELPE